MLMTWDEYCQLIYMMRLKGIPKPKPKPVP